MLLLAQPALRFIGAGTSLDLSVREVSSCPRCLSCLHEHCHWADNPQKQRRRNPDNTNHYAHDGKGRPPAKFRDHISYKGRQYHLPCAHSRCHDPYCQTPLMSKPSCNCCNRDNYDCSSISTFFDSPDQGDSQGCHPGVNDKRLVINAGCIPQHTAYPVN